MSSYDPATIVRRYQLLGYWFESLRTPSGVVDPVAPAPRSPDDLPMVHLAWAEWLFYQHWAGQLPDLPDALRDHRRATGSVVGVAPIGDRDRSLWERIRLRWREETSVDPGADAARISMRDEDEVGLAPWSLLTEYLQEASRDRLDPEPWWLFRAPALRDTPRDGEREALAPLEASAADVGGRVAPWSPFDRAAAADHSWLRGQLRERGFLDDRIGNQIITPTIAEKRGECLHAWGLSWLAAYRDAAQQLVRSRVEHVSIEWFRMPSAPPAGVDPSTWLARCATAAGAAAVPDGLAVHVPVTIDDRDVLLELRREDGETPVLVAARLSR